MKNKICKISLFSTILACVATVPAVSAVRTNNSTRSYADAYGQVNALRYQQEYMDAMATNATTASATASLPVMVSDEKLASEILNNTSETTIAHLENCAMIYPNGVFRWETPQSGIRNNKYDQCVAVVSLIDANTNAVLATTTVAAGDSMKCNIDSFPESGMNAAALSKTELPADLAPTMADVEAVMNQEQKQNAGFKIAAGAIIAGVAGNILAPKEAGSTKMFGTGKSQLIGTAAGVATGAGIMAASSYSGKVAGDTIKSTAVNAASGMLVGNMLAGASGESGMLVVKKCNIPETIPETKKYDKVLYQQFDKGEYDCIPGVYAEKGAQLSSTADRFYIINENGVAKACKPDDKATSDFKYKCDEQVSLMNVKVQYSTGAEVSFDSIFKKTDRKDTEFEKIKRYVTEDADPTMFKEEAADATVKDNTYYKVSKADEAKNKKHAYLILADYKGKFGGHKTSDLTEVKKETAYIYTLRNSNGTVGTQIKEEETNILFTPTSGSAEDGGLIDLSNQARTKGTLVGTAAGGALGGFAGYQGAKSEMTDRWTAAVREYEDSLSNFVCMTGNRYLSKYNDYIEIPDLKK